MNDLDLYSLCLQHLDTRQMKELVIMLKDTITTNDNDAELGVFDKELN